MCEEIVRMSIHHRLAHIAKKYQLVIQIELDILYKMIIQSCCQKWLKNTNHLWLWGTHTGLKYPGLCRVPPNPACKKNLFS